MRTLSLTSRVSALLALVAIMSCSRSAENSRSMAGPTAPSSLAAGQSFVDPASDRFHAMDANFPSPEDALAFRQVLEAKFRAEGRPVQTTFVNAEGVTVWTLEYLRYRSSGCSQAEAIDKVFAQIDRKGVAPLCSSSTSGALPPQSESLAFRQLLEVKYRDQLGAPPTQTYVDQPNEMLYTIEFVRYTQSGCSSATSYERIFVQIDGRGVEPDCRPTPPTCSFGVSPSAQNASASGGNFNATVTAEPSECSWQLGTNVSWITGSATSGTGSRAISYTVAPNPDTQSRTGRVTLVGSDGSQTSLQLTQAGNPTTPGPGPGPTTCTYALSPSPLNAIPEGGTYDVQVTAPAGCAWAAGSSANFVTIVSGATGTGNGILRLRVDGNPLDARQGTVELRYTGGQTTLLVSQVSALLRAVISAPTSCAVDTNCRFDGSASTGVITSYAWTFGDGGKGTGATVNYTYPRSYVANDYPDFSIDTTVTLTVTGPRGTSSATALVTVFLPITPPVAVISAPPSCAAETVCSFNGSASTGLITSYAWTFGDGGTGTGATTTYTYPRSYVANDYPDFSIDTTVTLTVAGPGGTSSATAVVTVFLQRPVAIITAPASCLVGSVCSFSGSLSTGPITFYSWNFGDFGTGTGPTTGPTVDHTYSFAYVSDDPDLSIPTTVTLFVSGPNGSASAQATVIVFDNRTFGLLRQKPPVKPDDD